MRRSFATCIGACLLLLLSGVASAEQKAISFTADVSKTVELDYLLNVPDGYEADDTRRWPLVLFLHGAGERGDDVWKVALHGPPKLIAAGKDIPAIVVSPQCPAGQWWDHHLEALSLLLDQIEADYRVDADRIYVTGLSMGGFGTWALASREPDRFAAAIPICGGANMIASISLGKLPIWAFHGEADSVVPLEETTRVVEAIQRRGGKSIKLTTYPGVNHDSWTQTYDNEEVWEWLFSKQRSND
ncbi:MAG: prolyl oligopeptidase family serine peptidase [Acidobacteriota bacterium]|nr:prolyl oligopeptidase family serine peptidase [Acidobacteriota bacterium]